MSCSADVLNFRLDFTCVLNCAIMLVMCKSVIVVYNFFGRLFVIYDDMNKFVYSWIIFFKVGLFGKILFHEKLPNRVEEF